nr:uncharacterized protein LOC129161832 isoform X2 [Nothobranchius furzeri]XP_054594283.1 uncharacterized protein LOC129161832 isoform X2 [Nothobranchius furzeri]XP_054594284.1 uncharacterized protein LOC129161832 isoform X2 [Nothobranchius furzeri]XP_054594285.1 uncharacterized protein LOC129161832 isoform X2 [Nothobranchius furzeri]
MSGVVVRRSAGRYLSPDRTPRSRDGSRSPSATPADPEVRDQGRVQDGPSRLPGAFLGAIVLPVHQVLPAPTPAASVQDAPDGVDRLTVEEAGRRRRRSRRREKGGLHVGLEPGGMEGGMDAESSRQPQPVRDRVDDPLDGVWAEEPRGEFLGPGTDPKVSRGHPDLVPRSIGGTRTVSTEMLVSIAGVSSGYGGSCFDPGALAASHHGFRCRNGDLGFLVGKDRGLEAIADLEGGQPSGR